MNDNIIKFLPITILLSFLIHLISIGVFFSFNQQKKVIRTTILDLASFKEFSDEILAKKKIEKKAPEIKKKAPPVVKKKTPPVVKKKLKIEEKKVNKKDSKSIVKEKASLESKKKPSPSPEEKKKFEKVEKKSEEVKRPLKTSRTIKNNNIKVNKNLKVVRDKELKEYLMSISSEINILANNQYPLQSIKRREQGSIITRIKIDKFGSLYSFEVLTKKPSRLFKSVKKILQKKNKFKTPPSHLFQDTQKLTFEISINYILK